MELHDQLPFGDLKYSRVTIFLLNFRHERSWHWQLDIFILIHYTKYVVSEIALVPDIVTFYERIGCTWATIYSLQLQNLKNLPLI